MITRDTPVDMGDGVILSASQLVAISSLAVLTECQYRAASRPERKRLGASIRSMRSVGARSRLLSLLPADIREAVNDAKAAT
jgi:hypothetical protein